MKLLLIWPFLSLALYAQVPNTQVGVLMGSAGGSYYDVPTNHPLSKYGPERLSPKGLSFIGTLNSDDVGHIYFRKISVARTEDQTKLGAQTLFLYDSPHFNIKEKKQLNLFINGKLMHYDQKDHFMYFKVDGEHTPTLDKNLQLEEHARLNQKQTYVAPLVGACWDGSKQMGPFNLAGFTQMSLAPVAFLNYDSRVTENKMNNTNLDQLDKSGKSFAFGGELVVEGVAKYKEQFYFKVRVMQSYMAGVNRDKVSATNRISHVELGYLVNKHLALNLAAENNELLFHNKDRHAIDVYNIVALGLTYSLVKAK
jgi:hypothetical protein